MSSLRAHCLIQLFPLCLLEESVSLDLVILSAASERCFWLMAILLFRVSLVAAPAVESHEDGSSLRLGLVVSMRLLSCSSLCLNICSLKHVAAKIATFQMIGIRKYKKMWAWKCFLFFRLGAP